MNDLNNFLAVATELSFQLNPLKNHVFLKNNYSYD